MKFLALLVLAIVCAMPPPAHALMFLDTFDDNVFKEGNWWPLEGYSGGEFRITSNRLEFRTSREPTEEEWRANYGGLYSRSVGLASKDFELQCEVKLQGGDGDREIAVGIAHKEFMVFVHVFYYPGGYIISSSLQKERAEPISSTGMDLFGDKTVNVKIRYDAKSKVMETFFKDSAGSNWIRNASFAIDGDRDGIHGNLNWRLKPDSPFNIYINSWANWNLPDYTRVSAGQMYVDNIVFTHPVDLDPDRVVFSSIGPLDIFDDSNAAEVGWLPDYKRGLAWPFVPAKTFSLDSIAIPLTIGKGNNLEISLWADNGSSDSTPKWEKVESLALNPKGLKFAYDYPDVVTFASKARPLLMQGRTYWLRLEPANKSFTSGAAQCLYFCQCTLSRDQPTTAYLPVEPGMKTVPDWEISTDEPLAAAFRIEGTPLEQNFILTNQSPYWDFRKPPGPAVVLSWTPAPAATGYQVWRDGVQIYPKTGSFKGRVFTNELGLQPGATHTFQIVGLTKTGKTVSNPVSVNMPADPGASSEKPGGLALRADNAEWKNNAPSVRLRWTDSVGGNTYEIYRDGKVLGKVGTQFEFTDDIGLKPGATVKYQIKCKNSAGLNESNIVRVFMPKAPPAAVGDFTLSYKQPTLTGTTPKRPSVTLSWTKAPGAATYDLYRNSVRIARDLKRLGYTDASGLAQGATYSYFVLAKGPGGETYSSDISITMPAENITSLGDFKLSASKPYWDDRGTPGPAVELKWTASKGAESYTLFRDGVPIRSGLLGTVFVNQVGLTPGGQHTFFVRAHNGATHKDTDPITIPMPAGPVPPTSTVALFNGVPSTISPGAEGSTRIFSIKIPPNTARLQVRTSGGTGDVDIFLKAGRAPKIVNGLVVDHIAGSIFAGNNEFIDFGSPAAGATFFILVWGKTPFSGVSITATFVPSTGKVATPTLPSSGVFSSAFPLEIFCDTPGVEIYFTKGVNPPNPDPKNQAQRYNPDRKDWIDGTTNVRAVAIKSGMAQSDVAYESYTRADNAPNAISVDPLQQVALGLMRLGEERVYKLEVPLDVVGTNMLRGACVVGFDLSDGKGNLEAVVSRNGQTFGNLTKKNNRFFDTRSVNNGDLGGTWTVRVRPMGTATCDGYTLTPYYLPVSVTPVSGTIQANKETWLICHGKNDSKNTFQKMAEYLDQKSTADQVLLVDWVAAHYFPMIEYRNGEFRRPDAATNFYAKDLVGSQYIIPTARKVGKLYNSAGISDNQIKWIGHSWGSLVGFEVAKLTGSNSKMPSLVALDPARNGGSIAGDKYPNHKALETIGSGFASVAMNSWAFVAPNGGFVAYGEPQKAQTAHDSFLVKKNGFKPSNIYAFETEVADHRAVWMVFERLMQMNYAMSPSKQWITFFRLENMLMSQVIWKQDQFHFKVKRLFDDPFEVKKREKPTDTAPVHEGVIHATVSSDGESLISLDQFEYRNYQGTWLP
jgi:pimeloyl-ACP methyl ester carboxylesterase